MRVTRVRKLASILVNHSLEVKPGHKVLIASPSDAKPLALAMYEECLSRGAYPFQRIQFPETEFVFYRSAKDHQIDFLSPIDIFILKECDRLLFIRTETNAVYLEKVNPSRITRRRRAIRPAHELLRGKRWCASFFPSRALAKRASMTVSEFADFLFQAVDQDWSEIELLGNRMADFINRSSTVHIQSPGTELKFSIAERRTMVGCGRFNLPDGEVFTAPVEDSAEGLVTFDAPVDFEGHVIRGARLVLRRGKIVEATAEQGEATLLSMLEVDPGAKRLGEFGIGINYGMSRLLGHPALDEKIGGTCHLAIGFSPPGTGGRNRSAMHFDLIKDLRSGGRISLDNQPLMEDGRLVI